MKKNTFCLFTVFFITASLLIPPGSAEAASGLPISAPSAVLIDVKSNRIIYAKTPHVKRAPASTTKVLTSIIAVERLDLDTRVRIPNFVDDIEPSKAYLRPGEYYYVRDLVRAALISSANDAAEVLAFAVAGSREKFADIMTQKARSIGAKRSRFVRASGLPAKGQYSTAYDMALIMREAEKYPFLVKAMKTRSMVIRSTAGRKIYLKNHNKMLWRDPRDIIGKTGWTRKAKHCFVGQVSASSRQVLISVFGSHSLWRDLKTLIDYQFGRSLLKIRKNDKLWSIAQTRKIQTALKRAGYNPGGIDGKFGPKTVTAIERFQRAKGLSADGIVGKQTWRKLRRYL